VHTTPDVVICEPWTSLIWPAGQEPSSTITRWPSLFEPALPASSGG
jgi:hypothetical protein